MSYEIKVPELPESVADATVLSWSKKPGDFVNQDDILVELETDKVVLEVPAPVSGKLASIDEAEGETVNAEQVLGTIDEAAQQSSAAPDAAQPAAAPAAPASEPQPAPAAAAGEVDMDDVKASPSVRKTMRENDIDPAQVTPSGDKGRVTKQDVLGSGSATAPAAAAGQVGGTQGRVEERVPMTRLRKRIAERLHEATQTTAMLTTFNEINMQPLMEMRNKYKEQFEKTHDSKLGFMSLFVRAATVALQKFPDVNASIEGDDIVYHGYCDVGIAVASARGLVVPILRNAEAMSLAEVEAGIADFSSKARASKLDVADLQGGTFTITNGGVFGSLFSTPILNPPQSAILGMHGISKRPVVENDEIVIRPMMYVALSYDHRIIDGQSAVLFLRTIKECVEDPQRILLEI